MLRLVVFAGFKQDTRYRLVLWKGGGSPQLYYHDCSRRIPGHTTRAPPVGFKLETNCFQFYAIANLDKTSLEIIVQKCFLAVLATVNPQAACNVLFNTEQ